VGKKWPETDQNEARKAYFFGPVTIVISALEHLDKKKKKKKKDRGVGAVPTPAVHGPPVDVAGF
jgi:hypothetical protein